MTDRPTPEQIIYQSWHDGKAKRVWSSLAVTNLRRAGYRIEHDDDRRARDEAIIRAVERWCGIEITDQERPDIIAAAEDTP